MKLGAVFPASFGGDPILIRDFVQTVEGLAYDYILIYEQIIESPSETVLAWPESLMVLSYIASLTHKLELATGIVVLPSRQTVLVAKQVAQLDRLAGGRLRFGVSAGWNEVEYQAMGVPYAHRGRRLDEQVSLLKQLWSQESVTFQGEFHHLEAVSIFPQPVQTSIPIWFGGHTDRVLERIARLGDGWMAVATEYATPVTLPARLDKLRQYCEEVGRNFNDIGLEIVDVRPTEARDWPQWVQKWCDLGATHLDIATRDQGLTTPQQHMEAMRKFKEAVG